MATREGPLDLDHATDGLWLDDDEVAHPEDRAVLLRVVNEDVDLGAVRVSALDLAAAVEEALVGAQSRREELAQEVPEEDLAEVARMCPVSGGTEQAVDVLVLREHHLRLRGVVFQ